MKNFTTSYFYLSILHIFNDGFLACFVLLLPFITKILSLNLETVGQLGTILNLGGIIAAFFVGKLAGEFGNKKVLLFASIIYLICFFSIAFINDLILLFPIYFFAGFGFGLFHPIAFATISTILVKEKLGNRMGNFTAIGDIGKFFISGLFTLIIAYTDYKVTVILFSIPLVITVIGVALLKQNEVHTKIKGIKLSFDLHLFRDLKFLQNTILEVLDNMASFSMMNFLPFLFLYKSFDGKILGYMVGVFFIGSIIGKLLLGKISDKYSDRLVFAISEFLMSFLIIILIWSQNLTLIVVTLIIIGIVTKGTVPVLNSILGKMVADKEDKAKYFGLKSLFTQIAMTITPWLYGKIGESLNINYVFLTMLFFALLDGSIALINIKQRPD